MKWILEIKSNYLKNNEKYVVKCGIHCDLKENNL